MIQSYADGELSIEMAEVVTTHIAACALCAEAVREAEQETAIFATAFAPEMSLSVPTARLRERLDVAIAGMPSPPPVMTESSPGSRLRAWLSSLFAPFAVAPRQAIGFASLAVALVAFALIFSTLYPGRSGSEYAKEVRTALPVAFNIPDLKGQETTAPVEIIEKRKDQIVRVRYAPQKVRPHTQANREDVTTTANNSPAPKPQPAAPPRDTFLPGERSYLTAIASLTTTLESNEGGTLKPSLRAEYERNLAVVDQAIEVTRRAARSNPRDEDAATFLLAAYQSKVDLLNTVADQARFSAR
jgi:hypothetical protein